MSAVQAFMENDFDPVTNLHNAEVHNADLDGGDEASPWNGQYQVLTPHMRAAGGSLGMVMNRLPPGAVGCPFHWHTLEDEVFYIISGCGWLRYGESTQEIGPGDCISCPAGSKTAHQIANAADEGGEDLVYLAAGRYDENEVCGYPDTGKLFIRRLKEVGVLHAKKYMEDEPKPPRIFDLISRET